MADGDDDLEFDLDAPPDNQGDQDPQDQDTDDQDEGAEGDQGPDDQGTDGVDAAPDRSPQSRTDDAGQPSRGRARISTLLEERRADRQRIDELNRRIDALLTNNGGGQRGQPTGETPEQRNARRATMTSEERMLDILAEDRQNLRGELQATQTVLMENADKTAFESLCASDKRVGRYKEAVERELATMRQQGFNAPREKVLRYVIGDLALKGLGGKETRQQRREAGQRVRGQTTHPANTRSDQQADRQQRTSLERRLENVSI